VSRKLSAMVLTLVLGGWLLAGCAPSGGKMTPATASTLQRDVDAVVSAADASRWDAAIDALNQLEADVASARAAGELSDQRAAQIRAVRQRVLEDLQQIRRSSPAPSPETTTQTTPSPETKDNDGNGDRDDGQNGKSDDEDQSEDGGGGKYNDEDQGEGGGDGKSKDEDQGEDGGGNHKGKDKR
jgi:hypothetical protein